MYLCVYVSTYTLVMCVFTYAQGVRLWVDEEVVLDTWAQSDAALVLPSRRSLFIHVYTYIHTHTHACTHMSYVHLQRLGCGNIGG